MAVALGSVVLIPALASALYLATSVVSLPVSPNHLGRHRPYNPKVVNFMGLNQHSCGGFPIRGKCLESSFSRTKKPSLKLMMTIHTDHRKKDADFLVSKLKGKGMDAAYTVSGGAQGMEDASTRLGAN